MNFSISGENYLFEQKIEKNIGIQLEGEGDAAKLYVKSIEDGEYSLHKVFRPVSDKFVVCYETDFNVFPKWIKIITNGAVNKFNMTESSASSSSSGGIVDTPEALATPEIDSFKEMKDFLAGYNNTQNMKDVIENSTAVASGEDLQDMFSNN